MAMDPTTLAKLRRYIAEPTEITYSDASLNLLYENNSGDLNATAAEVWSEKSALAAELVDISEGASARKNSQVFAQASQQRSFFTDRSDAASPASLRSATTRAIERA